MHKVKVSHNTYKALLNSVDVECNEQYEVKVFSCGEYYVLLKNRKERKIELYDLQGRKIEEKLFFQSEIEEKDIRKIFSLTKSLKFEGEYFAFENDITIMGIRCVMQKIEYGTFCECEILFDVKSELDVRFLNLIYAQELYMCYISSLLIFLIAVGKISQEDVLINNIRDYLLYEERMVSRQFCASLKNKAYDMSFRILEEKSSDIADDVLQSLKQELLLINFREGKCVNTEDDFSYTFYCEKQMYWRLKEIFDMVDYLYNLKLIGHSKIAHCDSNCLLYNIDNQYFIGRYTYKGVIEHNYSYLIGDITKKSVSICSFDLFALSDDIKRLIRADVAKRNTYQGGFCVHAAALERNGKIVIIVGDKYAGKTTNMISALLCNNAWNFVSNDLIYLYPESNGVYCFGSEKSIGIRSGSFELFPAFYQKTQRVLKDSSIVGVNKGYGSKFSVDMDIMKKNSIDTNVFFSPKELTKLIGCDVAFGGKIECIICPEYCSDLASEYEFAIVESKDVWRLLEHNLKKEYNSTQLFWNVIFGEGGEINETLKSAINSIKAYKVRTSKATVTKFWKDNDFWENIL